jgi:hypothetical protein
MVGTVEQTAPISYLSNNRRTDFPLLLEPSDWSNIVGHAGLRRAA